MVPYNVNKTRTSRSLALVLSALKSLIEISTQEMISLSNRANRNERKVDEKIDVVIVGCGVSGLSCAYKMRKENEHLKITLLEAKGRIGGRILGKAVQTSNGTEHFDFGGHWVGRSQLHVMRLVDELGLQLYEQSYDGKIVNILSNKKVAYTSSPVHLILTSFWMAYDLVKGFKKIDELSQMLSIENPLACKQAEEWDSMTLETAIRWIFTNEGCRKLLHVAILTMFGFEASQASFLYFLLYVRSSGGISALVDETFEGNAQEYRVKGGMFQIVQRLAEEVEHDNIKMNSLVTSIKQDEEACYVQTSDGSSFTSRYVVLAIPPHLRKSCDIHFEPPLPFTHQQHLRYLHPGHLIKCIATYPERFWNRKGLSGMAVHWPYYKEADGLPVSLTYDATSSTGSPALVGFIGGVKVAQRHDYDEQFLKNEIINSLVLMFGEEARNPIDVVFHDWTKEEYNGGCPVTFSSPGAIALYGDQCLRNSFHRIHFAGTETATIWRGFIDGAIQSGQRAANEILFQLNYNYSPHDVVRYEDILTPGLLTIQRNSYYALNGFLATVIIATITVLGYFARKYAWRN